jgi:hypothetical protein
MEFEMLVQDGIWKVKNKTTKFMTLQLMLYNNSTFFLLISCDITQSIKWLEALN